MRAKFRQVLPPFLLKALRPNSKYGWFGNYGSWNEAQNRCTGYDNIDILNKVRLATLKVQNGDAVYERDSVLFDSVHYSWPLLSAIMWVAALKKGKINVLDFGGSLGTSCFQNKRFLDTIEYNWCVVEQESFVKCGKVDIENENLQFFYSIEEVIATKGIPDLLVIACTLPYIRKPYDFLETLLQYKIPNLIVDNTFFNFESRDRVVIQKVPPEIYKASYPCWLLDYDKIISTVTNDYSIVSEHHNDSVIIVDGRSVQYRGFIATKK